MPLDFFFFRKLSCQLMLNYLHPHLLLCLYLQNPHLPFASFLSTQTLTNHATVWNLFDRKEEISISRKLWVCKSKQWENDLSYYCKFHLAQCSLILNKMFHHIATTISSSNISKKASNFSELLSFQTIAISPHHCAIAFFSGRQLRTWYELSL